VGRGKPYHFLQSLLAPPCDDEDSSSAYTQHGLRLEPDINDAYQLLTGLQTKVSGFWIADDSSGLAGIVGASPDAKVYENGRLVGLAEFKAPVYSLNCDGCRIPRAHMAQVQGQLAVCRAPCCDYMAVCTLTQQVALLRVHFAPVYWSSISSSLKNFCDILQVSFSYRRHCWQFFYINLCILWFEKTHSLLVLTRSFFPALNAWFKQLFVVCTVWLQIRKFQLHFNKT